MPLPRAQTARFQISMVKAKGIPRPTNAQASGIARTWIETGDKPDGWTIKVVIWSANRKREVTEIDDSPRGLALRATLGRALQSGRLVIKKVGGTR